MQVVIAFHVDLTYYVMKSSNRIVYRIVVTRYLELSELTEGPSASALADIFLDNVSVVYTFNNVDDAGLSAKL